jgi:general secretion pathway protein E
VQSALTGHLVLSTLHTNDAAGGVTRLLDMGLEEYLLTSTVNGILAQRLVRQLCVHCKQAYIASDTLIDKMRLRRFQPEGAITLFKTVGCAACGGLGYRGRLAIIEFLPMSDPIRKLIMSHASAGVIENLAKEEGMITLYENGLQKVLQGVTTLEEVMRVTAEN